MTGKLIIPEAVLEDLARKHKEIPVPGSMIAPSDALDADPCRKR